MDNEKAARVKAVILTHIKAVRDWHNAHPYTDIPEGINPYTGSALTKTDREVIANSSKPKAVHEALMTGLRKDLTEEQVEKILDFYTIGKVPEFQYLTYNQFRIIPELLQLSMCERTWRYRKLLSFKGYNELTCCTCWHHTCLC